MTYVNKIITVNLFGALFFLSAINCSDNKSEKQASPKITDESCEVPNGQPASEGKADSLVEFAKSLLGKSYQYASCGPNVFDCSGFVYYVFNTFNIKISRSSYTIAEEGEEVAFSEARKGDLIFFKGTDLNDPAVGHVGIIITEKGAPIEFIHSSSGKQMAVIITKYDESNYKARFLKVKRFI